eukprot:2553533-Rhodomonas_salina.4
MARSCAFVAPWSSATLQSLICQRLHAQLRGGAAKHTDERGCFMDGRRSVSHAAKKSREGGTTSRHLSG